MALFGSSVSQRRATFYLDASSTPSRPGITIPRTANQFLLRNELQRLVAILGCETIGIARSSTRRLSLSSRACSRTPLTTTGSSSPGKMGQTQWLSSISPTRSGTFANSACEGTTLLSVRSVTPALCRSSSARRLTQFYLGGASMRACISEGYSRGVMKCLLGRGTYTSPRTK